MNKYVSPIIEIADIDVEDILMLSTEEDDDVTNEKGPDETGGRPINPTSTIDAMNYFN